MGPFQLVSAEPAPSASIQSQTPGDANSDGFVNILDYNILQANFGQTDATFEQADFNGDGFVGLTDFNILAAHFVDA
jgi:hypothetical protein